MNKQIIVPIIVALIVGAAAFFAGIQYQKSQRQNITFTQGMGANGNGQMVRRFGTQGEGGQAVTGEIISKDDSSITVKMQDGSTKIILLSETTAVNKQATGSADDLTEGERVAVFGSSNSDGSVTAQNVQVNPNLGQRVMVAPPSDQ